MMDGMEPRLPATAVQGFQAFGSGAFAELERASRAGELGEVRRIVSGIDDVVREATRTGALYSELPAGWASAKPFRWLAEHA
jgi:hypothetical protein